MNSYSIETQQNAYSEQEHVRIADIYQRMLSGDKSALANLQKVKTVTNRKSPSPKPSMMQHQDSPQKQPTMNTSPKQPSKSKNYQSSLQSSVSSSNVIPINEEPLEESKFQQKSNNLRQDQKQKEKFRSYIKKKVNQLRSQRQTFKHQEHKQTDNTNKQLLENVKMNTVANQSKSYDLVRKKVSSKNGNNAKNDFSVQLSPLGNNKKQLLSVKQMESEKMKKTQSSSQHNKLLPPLKRKIPTESSEPRDSWHKELGQSRNELGTPINLVESGIKVQIKSNKKIDNNRSSDANKDSNPKQPPHPTTTLSPSKPPSKPLTKASLPQMRRQRQQFASINQQQKQLQLQLMQYHQQTKSITQQTKSKYLINYRNEGLLQNIKVLSPEPLTLRKQDEGKITREGQKQSPEKKKKGNFKVHQENIIKKEADIKLIDEAIAKKKQELQKITSSISKNLLLQFWTYHDLYSQDFTSDIDQQDLLKPAQAQQQKQHQPLLQSKTDHQAYITMMTNTKDKRWKRQVIKQYDTNRSLQQYAKSRSLLKASQYHNESNLKQIQQNNDQLQQSMAENRVTVNSRLRKLLLQ